MPLDTTIHSGFITDLVAPREGTCGLSAEELEQLSYDTALELLHDFPAFIRSNPLVTRVERIDDEDDANYIDVPAFRALFGLGDDIALDIDIDDSNNNNKTKTNNDIINNGSSNSYIHYSITDKLSFFLGAVRSNLVYQSALRKTATGFESFTSPGSGVKIHGTFNLYRSPDMLGVVHFIERNETKCNLFLGVYIKATLASSHKTLHENFKLAWNEALKRKLGAWASDDDDDDDNDDDDDVDDDDQKRQTDADADAEDEAGARTQRDRKKGRWLFM